MVMSHPCTNISALLWSLLFPHLPHLHMHNFPDCDYRTPVPREAVDKWLISTIMVYTSWHGDRTWQKYIDALYLLLYFGTTLDRCTLSLPCMVSTLLSVLNPSSQPGLHTDICIFPSFEIKLMGTLYLPSPRLTLTYAMHLPMHYINKGYRLIIAFYPSHSLGYRMIGTLHLSICIGFTIDRCSITLLCMVSRW